MTHAEEVARLRDAVVERAKVWCDTGLRLDGKAVQLAVDALRAAEAQTCETCEGSGSVEFDRVKDCPACHGTGRKPDKEEADG